MALLLHNTDRPLFTSLDFNELVLEAARSGALGEHLFILPTRRKLREVERDLTDEHFKLTGLPIERLPIYTFDLFAAEFYSHLQPDKRPLSPEIQLALMAHAMGRVDLSYYGTAGEMPSPGVVERITRVISGVRADGIMPSDFARDLEYLEANPDEPGYDRAKLRDLYNIYSEYLRLLNQYWIDYAGMMAYLNTEMFRDREATFRAGFPETRSIMVYGFSEFTQPEIALLQQLGYLMDMQVLIYLDYAEENGPLYGNFEDVFFKMTAAGYHPLDIDPLQTDIPEEERRPFQHHMRKNLFRTDDRIENPSFDQMTNIYGFFNREEEAQGIASLVKSLVIDERIPLERICITCYRMEPYARLFQEQLASHGVPANITTPFTLEGNGLVIALLAALAIPANSYDRRDVIRAITSPYLDFGGGLDPAALVEASARLRIRRGRLAWSRRIGQRIEYLLARSRAISDLDEVKALEIELETLRRAGQGIDMLSGMLEEFDRRMTPGEFRLAFQKLVAKLHAAENVLKLRHDLESRSRTPQDWQRIHDEMERDTRALAAFFRMLDEMTEFFEVEEPEGGRKGDGRYGLDFYIEQLRTASLRASYRLREKHDYGVLVTPTGGMRGLEFDAVIVCGLVDGEFPSTYIPENFLGKPLPKAQERQLRRERMEFYSAITQASKRLILTYPRYAGDTALVRSSFVDALLRITTIEESERAVVVEELRVLRDRARRREPLDPHTEFLSRISTYEALTEEAGAAIWSGQPVPQINEAEEVMENLRHTAAVEKRRYQAAAEQDYRPSPEYLGVISDCLSDEEKEILARRREREYSPSQLELYARCPFKYFAKRVLHIVPPADYDITLTPLERGLLLHSVLFRLYSELRDRAELPITEERRGMAIERARELAREEIAGIFFDHPYWKIDQERLLGSSVIDGLLEEWIDSDIERTSTENSKLTPEFFEVNFGGGRTISEGMDGQLSTGEGVKVHSLNVQGRVDRVEVFRRGDEIYFSVADYKTGVPPTRRHIREGRSMQLMIYLEVMRKMLAEHFGIPPEKVRPAGGIYYRLDTKNIQAKMSTVFVPNELKHDIIDARRSQHDPETVADLEIIIEEVFSNAQGYVDDIASGVFHVTTRDINEVCRGCEYQSVCRVSLVGVKGKG